MGSNFRFDYVYSEKAGGFLKLHIIPARWNEARLRCRAEGAVLASPLTKQLESAILEFVHGNHKKENDYMFYTGVHSTFSTGSYASIEEYRLEVSTGSCYKFHRRGLPWHLAHMTCDAEGGHLAIINSEEEATALKDLYSKNPDTVIFASHPFAASIGFHDWGVRGTWMTIHCETLDQAGFARWANGQPDNATRPRTGDEGEFCGSILRNGFLADLWCHVTAPFICEKHPNSLNANFLYTPKYKIW